LTRSAGEQSVKLDFYIASPAKSLFDLLYFKTHQFRGVRSKDIKALVEELLKDEEMTKEKMQWEIEKLIRAYDPCMSCASHFLKINWDGYQPKASK